MFPHFFATFYEDIKPQHHKSCNRKLEDIASSKWLWKFLHSFLLPCQFCTKLIFRFQKSEHARRKLSPWRISNTTTFRESGTSPCDIHQFRSWADVSPSTTKPTRRDRQLRQVKLCREWTPQHLLVLMDVGMLLGFTEWRLDLVKYNFLINFWFFIDCEIFQVSTNATFMILDT